METQATVQNEPTRAESRKLENDWAEAEWFREWLRLARRDYQGTPPTWPEFRKTA